MTFLDLTGWRPGLNTVALIEAIKLCRSRSLASAKRDVERLLDGETIRLEFDTEEEKEAFRMKAEGLGVIVQ